MNNSCPNCGSSVSGPFCSECGQEQGDLVPSLGAWLSEALDELLFVEARLPRTIKALLWPPGRLTVEWLRGRRASYVSPLRLYLLVALPFFLVLSMTTPRGLGEVLEVVVGSMPVVFEDEGYLEPIGPLPGGQEADSAVRAEWQAEFLRRSAHNDSISRLRAQRVETGLGRVFDLLPLVVGLLMIPGSAGLLRGASAGRIRFITGLTFSLHTHAMAYLAALLAWPLGLAGLAGSVCAVVYVTGARTAVLEEHVLQSIAFSLLVLIAYIVGFLVIYVLFVIGLATYLPGWAYGSI